MPFLINDKSLQKDFRIKTPIIQMKENNILASITEFFFLKKIEFPKSYVHIKMLKILFTRI
jgi:hypothetical protein